MPFLQQLWHALPLPRPAKARLRYLVLRLVPALGRLRTGSVQVDWNGWGEAAGRLEAYTAPEGEFVPRTDVDPPEDPSARLVCFYLPQYHRIPENDAWWGEGFTDWVSVRRAVPQFAGHEQPRIPGALGEYDLRDREALIRQVELARAYGIGGFCFYVYWFGGRRLLEAPVDRYRSDPSFDLPYCLCWANENWSRRWDGHEEDVLIAQQHSPADDIAFIEHIADALRDERYIRVEGRPLLLVYRPGLLPSAVETAARWRTWCRENGIGEICLAYTQSFEGPDPQEYGFDVAVEFPPNFHLRPPDVTATVQPVVEDFGSEVLDWRRLVQRSSSYASPTYPLFRGVCPGWDNTARRGNRSKVLIHNTPGRFAQWLSQAIGDSVLRFERPEERLVFVNAWNEWAEAAYLEPDTRHGYAWLEAVRVALARNPAPPSGVEAPRLAIAVHAYYPEILGEILGYLQNLPPQHELFVTTTAEHERAVRSQLATTDRVGSLTVVANRGRDVLPFRTIFPSLRREMFQVVLKLHTKRTSQRADGAAWRRELVRELLDPATVELALRAFRNDPGLGMIGPAGHYVSLAAYLGSNQARLCRLAERMGLEEDIPGDHCFFAGTMFYARCSALEPLLGLAIGPNEFEEEAGQMDGTLAHALERAFPLSVLACGMRVADTASLVGGGPPAVSEPVSSYRYA